MQQTLAKGFTAEAHERAHDLAQLFAEELQSHDDAIFTYDREPEAIESEPRSGFIPFTSGGAELVHCASIGYARGTGCAPAPIEPLIEASEKMMQEEWKRQHPDRPDIFDCMWDERATHPDLFAQFETPIDDGSYKEEWARDAEEWESEWFMQQDDVYYYKARVMFLAPDDRQNDSGEAEVSIDCYLVTDSYGRDSVPWLSAYGGNPDQTSGEFNRTIAADEFAAMDQEALEKLVAEAIDTLP